MSIFEVTLSILGALGTILLTGMGFLLNRQFTKLDSMDKDFLETKSKMLEITTIGRNDKRAIIDHLEQEILPKLQNKKLEDQVADVKTQLIILKEFQRNRIEPTLNKVLIMGDRLEEQSKKQTDSDQILAKMFEVVKRLVEKKNQN